MEAIVRRKIREVEDGRTEGTSGKKALRGDDANASRWEAKTGGPWVSVGGRG